MTELQKLVSSSLQVESLGFLVQKQHHLLRLLPRIGYQDFEIPYQSYVFFPRRFPELGNHHLSKFLQIQPRVSHQSSELSLISHSRCDQRLTTILHVSRETKCYEHHNVLDLPGIEKTDS